MPLIDSLVSYYKLDEASGDALDAHGSNNLTDNGTVGAGTGIINGARDFESSVPEYFTHADNADFSTGDIDFAFSLWVKIESISGVIVVFRKDDGSANREYGLYYDNSAARFKFYVFGSASGGNFHEVAADNLGVANTGVWYHLICWHDSVNNLIGIVGNGGTANTLAHTTGVYNGTASFGLGGDSTSSSASMDGLIDEFGFWKRVLSEAEWAQLYNSGAALPYPFSAGGGGAAGSLAMLGVGQ
jgi:concanavalin A-like lectin/glucanase superfamily protein